MHNLKGASLESRQLTYGHDTWQVQMVAQRPRVQV